VQLKVDPPNTETQYRENVVEEHIPGRNVGKQYMPCISGFKVKACTTTLHFRPRMCTAATFIRFWVTDRTYLNPQAPLELLSKQLCQTALGQSLELRYFLRRVSRQPQFGRGAPLGEARGDTTGN
jgi:hypothetical protein